MYKIITNPQHLQQKKRCISVWIERYTRIKLLALPAVDNDRSVVVGLPVDHLVVEVDKGGGEFGHGLVRPRREVELVHVSMLLFALVGAVIHSLMACHAICCVQQFWLYL